MLATAGCRENAVILTLCRNEELEGIDKSIGNLEERFNSRYKYPYVFLNDKEFTEEFKGRLSKTTDGRASFGHVDAGTWNMPQEIDKERAKKAWEGMGRAGVPYANMESYHNMCRFFSRSFYKHPLVKDYEFYWRVEPDVQFRCDIDEDPFEYLRKNKKKYGFVIAIREFMASIPTLASKTAEFLVHFYNVPPVSKRVGGKNHLGFMFENGDYNGCHFWSNFEIASFEFLRSEEYNSYVNYLEKEGGFYYERWGDAPVHSIAASILLDKSEIHFFDNIGYTHGPFTHCPSGGKNCNCSVSDSVDFTPFSCLRKYLDETGSKK